MLDDRINSVLHWYWGTGYIFDPVRQVHLSIVPILWYRVNFWCCMTGLPQCCIDTEKQDIFLTLHNRFNSVLHQYCHTGWISDVAWQDYLNVALILRSRMYFLPCITGLPQYCINTVMQGDAYCMAVLHQDNIKKNLELKNTVIPEISKIVRKYWALGC